MGREFTNSDTGSFRKSRLPSGTDDGGDISETEKKDEDSEVEEETEDNN